MDIQPIQILLQIANFSILMFVLVKFLYQPLTKVLDQRSQKIEEGMVAAEKNIKEAGKMEETVKEEISKARKEAAKITAEARKNAETDAQAILDKAKAEAKKAIQKERQAFEATMKEEEQKLQAKLADLVTQTTAQLLRGTLAEKDQKAIIAAQLKQLKKV